jgi:predicted dehydrogenase
MNVGVIGSGFGKRVVAPTFAATGGCTVVDVVSARDADAIASLVERNDVDLVSVHSPPFLHAPHVRAALAAGKHVLCDKPFARNAEEADELAAEAHAAGVVALCNFEFRYAPARGIVRDLVDDEALGAIEHVQWTHISAGSRVPLRSWGWLFERELGGGWIGAWASHAVDALRHLFDTEVDATDALLRIDVKERPDEDGEWHRCTAEDGFTASLVLRNGATVAIDSSFAAVATLAPRLVVFGSDAVAEIVADERVVVRRPGRDPEMIDAGETDPDRHALPMRRFAEVVRDTVTSGDVPPGVPTFADGAACDAVLDDLRAAPFAPA